MILKLKIFNFYHWCSDTRSTTVQCNWALTSPHFG